ncbi:DUF998 domain-containing protein [Aquisphaera insulae]|uniref:DUF998 domain-containing protein n=1 Tax=Aquisphaera insulae TaxID=2712864 RepID=UPI0013EAE594|nr:DUF998 domain-containing protein [Aquisphaera insulae]
MRHGTTADWLTLRALWLGIAIPFLYYGIQAAAAPFFPGFSFVGTTASELGSDRSGHPVIFNLGIMVQGVATLVAAFGFLLAFERLGINRLFAWPTSLAIAMNGVQTLWAGYFPMPDPRHGGHPVFLVFMLAQPILLAVSMRPLVDWRLRAYFLANLVLLAAMVPVMMQLTGLDTHTYRGLIQRLFALAIFPPIGVAAFALARRVNARAR